MSTPAATLRQPPDADALIRRGTPQWRQLNVAMLAAGLAGFAMLYATQALLPEIGADLGAGATLASATVSVATGTLALAVAPMSAFAEQHGRTRVMIGALAVAVCSVFLGALSPDLAVLLVLRAVDGLALAGVIAVAMGHVGASVHPDVSGPAIGVYVSGTTLGGLVGRLVPALVSTTASWRVSMMALAGVGALCTIVFARLVPAGSRNDVALPPARVTFGMHLRDAGVLRLCAVAMLCMGGFVGTYNFLTYRLGGHPFDLSPALVGLVFLAYLAGTVTSTVATRLAVRFGRRGVVLVSVLIALAGIATTLPATLPVVLVGLVVFTVGFFGVHSVASGWTAARAAAHKSHAAALYVMAYYLGSSIGGTLIGFAWSAGGWPAVVACVGACFAVAGAIAAGIRPSNVS